MVDRSIPVIVRRVGRWVEERRMELRVIGHSEGKARRVVGGGLDGGPRASRTGR